MRYDNLARRLRGKYIVTIHIALIFSRVFLKGNLPRAADELCRLSFSLARDDRNGLASFSLMLRGSPSWRDVIHEDLDVREDGCAFVRSLALVVVIIRRRAIYRSANI